MRRIAIAASVLALGGTVASAGEFWREAPAGVPGAVLVTSAGGRDSFECVGYADLEARRRMTPDTVFWMASNTKGVAAATVLSVVSDGKLLLDDPVEKYFPSWAKLAATNRPTVRMLLSHTAGLPFFTDRPLPGPGMAALAERAAEQPLAYEPGAQYRYSNWGIDVAMAVVEKATGRPFEVEMEERVLKPLGMRDTAFVPSEGQRARQVVAYRLAGTNAPVATALSRNLAEPYLRYGVHPEAGGGLLSTPRDMIRFFRMIADGGRAPDGAVIVPEGLMKAWTSRQTPPSADVRYSLGMRVDKNGNVFHGGSAGTWGEANVRTHRARLFMVNVEGGNAAYKAFKENWKKLTDLDSRWFSYPSNLLALDRTATQRKELIRDLWAHDRSAETRIWPEGRVPLRKDDKPLRFVEKELWQRNLVVSDINDPFFTFFPARGVTNAPVAVVLPGGGYAVLGWNKEGSEIAEWLNANGFSAAVLLYRVPHQRAAALCDVQRTIGILRRDAMKYGINPKRVGVIGFSAGANLAVAASTNWRRRAYERVDDADDQPCRPDFQLPIYLWDVLERDPDSEDIRPLLDNGREPNLRAEYPVDAETPPAFLAQAKDDFCQIETSVTYFRALQAAGVKPCRIELMESGGHGYGLRTVGNPTDRWSALAAEWLKEFE